MKGLIKTNPHFLRLRPDSWWLLLIDPVEHFLGPEKFENDEPGYLKGMFTGLNYLIRTLGEPLTAKYIVDLHDHAVSNTYIKYKNSSNVFYLEKFAKGVRHNYAVSFGLVTSGPEQNCTKEGFIEVLHKLADGDRSFYISDHSGSFRLDAVNIVKPLTEKYIDEIWQEIETKHCLVNTLCQSQEQVHTTLADKVSQYNAAIQQAHTLKEKIRAIVTFIHDVEIFHSLPDGNCRSLGVLLIKKLAIENGFPPVVLSYRDRIDCYSIDQLCEEFEIGIANFERLQSAPTHPDAVIYLENNEQIACHVAESALMTLPFWDRISQTDQESAISLVQTVLLSYDKLTSKKLESILKNIQNTIANSTYKKHPLQTCFFGNNTHEYAICFENSLASFTYQCKRSVSLKILKNNLQKEEGLGRSLTDEDCDKIAITIVNDYKEFASQLTKRHFSKKAIYDYHYIGMSPDQKVNQRNHAFLEALRALPQLITTKHKNQLDKLDPPDSLYHLRTMVYLLLEEFNSREFFELPLALQNNLKKDSLIVAIRQWQLFSIKPLEYAVELYNQASNDCNQNRLLSTVLFKLTESPSFEHMIERGSGFNNIDPLYRDMFVTYNSLETLPELVIDSIPNNSTI